MNLFLTFCPPVLNIYWSPLAYKNVRKYLALTGGTNPFALRGRCEDSLKKYLILKLKPFLEELKEPYKSHKLLKVIRKLVQKVYELIGSRSESVEDKLFICYSCIVWNVCCSNAISRLLLTIGPMKNNLYPGDVIGKHFKELIFLKKNKKWGGGRRKKNSKPRILKTLE